jgi:hypothetical protein
MHFLNLSWSIEVSIACVQLNLLTIFKLLPAACFDFTFLLEMHSDILNFFILLIIIIDAIYVINCMSTVSIVSFLTIRSVVMIVFI